MLWSNAAQGLINRVPIPSTYLTEFDGAPVPVTQTQQLSVKEGSGGWKVVALKLGSGQVARGPSGCPYAPAISAPPKYPSSALFLQAQHSCIQCPF